MRRSKCVVDTFFTTRETTQAPLLAQAAHARISSRQNLVRIRLMADIPDEPILWGVEDIVQRNGQLHRAQVGAEVATRLRHGLNQTLAQLQGQPLQTVAR